MSRPLIRRPSKGKRPDYSKLPATAPLARTLGETLYFTGRPCKQGHIAPRRVGNHECRDCHLKLLRAANKRHTARLRKLYGKA